MTSSSSHWNTSSSSTNPDSDEPHSYFTLRQPHHEDIIPLTDRSTDPFDIEQGPTCYADRQNDPFAVTPRHRNQPELGRAGSDINLYRPELLNDVNERHGNHRKSPSIGTAPDVAFLTTGVGNDEAYAQQLHNDDRRAMEEQQSRVPGVKVKNAAARPAGGKVTVQTIPRVLLKPKVARQIAKRAAVSHRPYFVWTVSLVHVVLLVASFIINYTLTGNVIETFSRNPMIGPSSTVLINMGARFAPCMRTVPSIGSTTPVPCPNCTDPTSPAQQLCTIDQLCGFGGFPPNQPNQWFRFLIPIFLHGGIVHLIFNLMFQWRTGMEMEKDMGTVRFGLIYMISGVVGFIFGANFAPLVSVSVGASGGLFGLIGCLLLDLLQNWKLIVNPVTELCKMLAMLVISFAMGLLPGFDNFAHIGGFVSGLLAGIILLPRINFGKWDRRVKIGSMVAAIPLLVLIFVFTLTNFYNVKTNPAAACPWCKYLSCLPVNGWCDAFDVSASQKVT